MAGLGSLLTSRLEPLHAQLGKAWQNILGRPEGNRTEFTCGRYESVHRFFETPHDNPSKSMLSVTAYLDESQHTGPGHVVVAGFCGDEDMWNGFAGDWKTALGHRSGLHVTELRWNGRASEKRVKSVLERLGSIPLKNRLMPVYGAVKSSDYLDLLVGKPEFEKKICGYAVCLSIIFTKLTKLLAGHLKIKIVCERQDRYEPLARALFDSFVSIVGKDPRNPYFSGIEFIPKESSMLTQPADYLAFALGKYLDERGSKKDLWCRPIFGEFSPNKIPGHVYTRERARQKIIEIMRRVDELEKRGFLSEGYANARV
jgi:hypothetical protein